MIGHFRDDCTGIDNQKQRNKTQHKHKTQKTNRKTKQTKPWFGTPFMSDPGQETEWVQFLQHQSLHGAS